MQDRLYPDMFCLARQIRQSADFGMNTGGRLAGVTPPALPTVDDTSFAAAKQRVETALAFVNSLTRAQVDGAEDKTIAWTAGGNERKMKGKDYLQQFACQISIFLSRRHTTFCAIAACRSAREISSARSTGSDTEPVPLVRVAPVGPTQLASRHADTGTRLPRRELADNSTVGEPTRHGSACRLQPAAARPRAAGIRSERYLTGLLTCHHSRQRLVFESDRPETRSHRECTAQRNS